MKINLRIDGKDKTFINDYVTLRDYRNAVELRKYINEKGDNLDEMEMVDKMSDFAVRAFNNQFTVDEVMDGLPARDMTNILIGIYRKVLSLGEGTAEPEDDDEGNEAGK